MARSYAPPESEPITQGIHDGGKDEARAVRRARVFFRAIVRLASGLRP